jgi:hypothetical protein
VKERDEQIELVLEKLENEKDEAIEQNKKEKAARMGQLLEEKHQLEKKLQEYNTNFTNLKNTTLLVCSILRLHVQTKLEAEQ